MTEFTTIAKQVYKELKDKIVYGELKPGERLIQRKLAKEFGISTMPIVDAIGKLEHDSLVEYCPGLGARVKIWSFEDMVQLMLLRGVFEAIAVRIYAVKATSEQRKMLEEYGRQFDEAVRAKDYNAVIRADTAIHMHLIKCMDMPIIHRFIENSSLISITLRRNPSAAFDSADDYVDSAQIYQHDELIKAANSGDPDKAEEVARAVLSNAIGIWEKHLGKKLEIKGWYK